MLDGKRITVVLPAYEAARTLALVASELRHVSVVDDIVLVDDASPDGTADLSESLGLHTVRHETNGGYGGQPENLLPGCAGAGRGRGRDAAP